MSPEPKELRIIGAKVWYDEFTLELGSNLRQEIDKGLTDSHYGIVVLWSHFFQKKWPQRELDGLISLEDNSGEKRILPIWHEISKDEVIRYSPTLSNRKALEAVS